MTSLWLLAFVRSVFFAAAHHTKLEVLLSVLWDSKKWNNLWDSLMEKQGMLDGNVTVWSSPTRLRLLCKASFGFKENSQFWSDRSNLAKKTCIHTTHSCRHSYKCRVSHKPNGHGECPVQLTLVHLVWPVRPGHLGGMQWFPWRCRDRKGAASSNN